MTADHASAGRTCEATRMAAASDIHNETNTVAAGPTRLDVAPPDQARLTATAPGSV
jgi:hypothetical protein